MNPEKVRSFLKKAKTEHENSKDSSTFKDLNLKKLFETIISPNSKIGIFYTPK